MIHIHGMTWSHTRGYLPMIATAQRYSELHPEVTFTWDKRSLQEFADKPLDELAGRYDLLVIDHPWAGFAATSGILVPLEKHLPASFLADQADHSVGRSHPSYQFNGSQWALAIDAATPVSAYRPDLLAQAGASLPRSFDELIALGQRGLVCCPSIPLDVYGNFLNLCMAAGETLFPDAETIVRREAGLLALERLQKLAAVVPPRFFDLNPIRTLEAMSRENTWAYCPYTYGYSNYARPGYASHLLRFGDVIGIQPGQPGATMLGGTGLAISAKCRNLSIALDYAQFVAGPSTQRGLFFQAGGQPGHRSAWTDPSVNAACSDCLRDTLPTLDRAFVRPRYAGYLGFQDRAGEPIHHFLKHGGSPAAVFDQLTALYRASLPTPARA